MLRSGVNGLASDREGVDLPGFADFVVGTVDLWQQGLDTGANTRVGPLTFCVGTSEHSGCSERKESAFGSSAQCGVWANGGTVIVVPACSNFLHSHAGRSLPRWLASWLDVISRTLAQLSSFNGELEYAARWLTALLGHAQKWNFPVISQIKSLLQLLIDADALLDPGAVLYPS